MIDFILGENKHVRFLVCSRKEEAFSINSASWELYYDGQLEASGKCDIENLDTGLHLDIMLEPKNRSRKYQLFITYLVGDETKKHVERMEVR